MIDSLSGTLLEKTPDIAVIECGGVGYLAAIPSPVAGALPAVGEKATLYTVMHVAENAVGLFGFADKESRALFKLLTGVSGVGPKVGLAVLSALPPERLVLAISSGDFKSLTAASGVGQKLAQRLVLELKDKVAGSFASGGIDLSGVAAVSAPGPAGAAQQAVAALVSLGYSQSEAAAAVAPIDPGMPVQEIIRLALRGMGGKGGR